MSPSSRPAKAVRALFVAALIAAVAIGASTGLALAGTANQINSENFSTPKLSLPSRVYDIKGRLITEFFAGEKREIVSIRELPRHLIDAFVIREDKTFFRHRGFDLKRIVSAAWGVLTRTNRGGGSTITQQVAGDLLDIRRDRSLKRKLVELWYALQLERRYSKDEILETYLNRVVMGPGVYGVEAASKFFFGHSAREDSLAESAILALQMNPELYNPYRQPKNASARSRELLDQMVRLGLAGKEEADESYRAFWDNYDFARADSSAYYRRFENDKAPWFSEYVHRQLDDMLYGSYDLYSSGLAIHTTLDLDQQASADYWMAKGIAQVNRTYSADSRKRLGGANGSYLPIVEMLALGFDLDGLFAPESEAQGRAFAYYKRRINPVIDATALLFGLPILKSMADAASARLQEDVGRTKVEGSLITIEPETGYITALVGGSEFEEGNQWIRAVQSRLQPGSTFKPLYYSAAIDSREFTEATLIEDSPTIFQNADGTPYSPLNYKGKWEGPVLAWYALAHSLNIPSVKVLEAIGFDAAIDRAASLLAVGDPEERRRTFPRVYSLALGVLDVTPLSLARAYGVFANQGREVDPISIRSVEDRNGLAILEPEKELRTLQRRKGRELQVVSQQNAAIMVDMLERVVASGTLAGPTAGGSIFSYVDGQGKRYSIPAAGKTGTTDNWADAWTVGFTPYYATAIWFGFDKRGNSLGTTQSGGAVAGEYWSKYMRQIHRGLPQRNFQRPQSGLVELEVCSVTGLLPTPYCLGPDGKASTVKLSFLEGTEPSEPCEWHRLSSERDRALLEKLEGQVRGQGKATPKVDPRLELRLPGLDLGGSSTGE